MSYNPVFELVSGLFLILVPLVLVGWLALFLLLRREEPSRADPRPGSPEDWSAWLDSTAEQAGKFREEFSRNGNKPLDPEGASEKLNSLIESLRALAEERGPVNPVEAPNRDSTDLTSPPAS